MKTNRFISASTRSALLHFSAFFLLIATILLTPQFKNLDRKINDVVLQTSSDINSSDIVIVDIDQKTVASAKSFPISRGYIAEAVSEIASQNPKRVLLDILLVAEGKQSDDEKLKETFSKFNKGTLAIAGLDPVYTSGKAAPNPKFTENATVVNSVVAPDRDGFYRRLGSQNEYYTKNLNNPARWLAGKSGSDVLILDQSTNPNGFTRYSLSDFVEGEAPNISGKLVIVGQVSRLLGVPVHYPIQGNIDRTQFIALGASTLINGEEQYDLSFSQLVATIAFVSFIACLFAFKLVRNVKLLRTTVVSLTVILGANFFLHYYFNISLNIIVSSLAWKAAFFITLAYKYRLLDVIREVMSGDLSPEEAWQWRAMKEHQNPCVLMGLKGIKRINQSALNSKIFDDGGSNLLNFKQAIKTLDSDAGVNLALTQEGSEKNFQLTQPFDNIALYQLRDTTNEQIEKDRLAQLIFTDQLTNCLNKAGFENALTSVVADNSPYSIFILDLNGFKAANDTYGHLAGDIVLTECAKRLQTVLRNTDTLARIGGDEFAVIAQGQISEDSLLTMRDKLEESIGSFVQVGKNAIKIGISAGYSQALPGQDSKTVMENADAAMYERKTYLKSIGQAATRDTAA
jgi:diguanylate cyclase (GGDEF)-like protein